jgi:hypothetical protein
MRRLLRLLLLTATVAVAVLFSWDLYNRLWFRSFVPKQIGVESVLLYDSVFLWTGCGAAIFELDRSTIDALARDGLRYLRDARSVRGNELLALFDDQTEFVRRNDKAWSEWKETPARDTGSAMSGLGASCADLKGPRVQNLEHAVSRPGSYFTMRRSDSILVVSPELGLAGFIYASGY